MHTATIPLPALTQRASTTLRTSGAKPKLDAWLIAAWIATIIRFPMAAAGVAMILSGASPLWASAIILALVVFDILDGELLAQSKHATPKRRIFRHAFDAVGDRVVIHAVLFSLLISTQISLAVTACILLREIVLWTTVLRPWLTRGVVLEAVPASKLATVFVALLAIDGLNALGATWYLLPLFIGLGAAGVLQHAATARDC